MAEVFFCNLCDQSVPLVEMQEGRALRKGERVLCNHCQETILAAAPKASGKGMLLPVLLALLGWVAAGLVWLDRRDATVDLEGRVATGLQEAGGARLQQASDLRRVDEQGDQERALLRSELQALDSRLQGQTGDHQQRLQSLEKSVEELGQFAADQEVVRSRLDQVEANLSVVEDRQRAGRAAQEVLRDELARLDDTLGRLQRAAPSKESVAQFSPQVAGLLRDLQSDDREVRYKALDSLSEMEDARLLPHLYPMLADPYAFNRFLAAYTMMIWEAKEAAPHLIEVLLDEEGFVREQAVLALRRLTGQNFGYDHSAGEEDRKRGYNAWKAWWKSNGEQFMADLRS
ncbi:MAG: hypothetical protein DWQ01_11835 [Planctomycetota bacterium]|nr:MAG: hypothetical protein DWQ01_11835 [Planctomycetota bacterium]